MCIDRLSVLYLLALMNLCAGTYLLELKRLGIRGETQQGYFPVIRVMQWVFSSLADAQRLVKTLRIPSSNRLEEVYANR